MPGLASQEHGLVNERKFVGDRLDLPFVLALLDARLLPDRYHETGRINSVYFDTPGLRAWDEKANGDNLKRKVRARWYGRPEELGPETPVFLELKHRIGAARRKERIGVAAPTDLLLRAPLSDPRWPALFAAHAEALGEPVGPEWSPVCRIEYDPRVRRLERRGLPERGALPLGRARRARRAGLRIQEPRRSAAAVVGGAAERRASPPIVLQIRRMHASHHKRDPLK